MDIVHSVNSVPIRMTSERWKHIVAKVELTDQLLEELAKTSPTLADLPTYPVWLDYDREADVLYLSFEQPQDATDSRMLDNGILLRYRGDKLVGITIFEASKR